VRLSARRRPRPRTKKFWNVLTWLVLLAGIPWVIWAGVSSALETYAFWRHGIEKTAHVVDLDHTTRVPKGGTSFRYVIEVDGRRFVESFRMRLPAGGEVAVLALPEDPDHVTLGNSESSAFEIYSNSLGGSDVMAVLVIATFGFVTLAAPWLLVVLIKVRREMFDG
jgi:hypothetical protein